MGQLSPVLCQYCQSACTKKGWYKTVQKLYCKACHKFQRLTYCYRLTSQTDDNNIVRLNNEGMGISSIGRYLYIAKTTVRRRIMIISKRVQPPVFTETGQVYEIDEIQTFIGRNHPSCYVYITYAINRTTREVIDFVVGQRSKAIVGKVVNKVLSFSPLCIYTDGLNIYPSLVPASIHKVFRYHTNIIERNNLTLRIHLKRLNRRTICFSKSTTMLAACLSIYFSFCGGRPN